MSHVVSHDGAGVEWEVEDGDGEEAGGRRWVKITLAKQSPREDMVHWWPNVFQGDPEIDTTQIQGRKMNFAEAWEEAQALFKKGIAEKKMRPPVEVDL
jgi:hypothetical protein